MNNVGKISRAPFIISVIASIINLPGIVIFWYGSSLIKQLLNYIISEMDAFSNDALRSITDNFGIFSEILFELISPEIKDYTFSSVNSIIQYISNFSDGLFLGAIIGILSSVWAIIFCFVASKKPKVFGIIHIVAGIIVFITTIGTLTPILLLNPFFIPSAVLLVIAGVLTLNNTDIVDNAKTAVDNGISFMKTKVNYGASVNTPNGEKFCYSCAETIKAAAEVCPKCGVRQGRRSMGAGNVFCHSCGQTIKAAAEVCPKCGVRQIDYKHTFHW